MEYYSMKMEVDNDSNHSYEFDSCKKCQNYIDDPDNNPGIPCLGECQQMTHIRCLVPNCLLGDVFYDYFCSDCSELKKEEIVRQKLPWLTVVLLAIHNLRIKSIGLSEKKYFHWKTHITKFIDDRWDILFPSVDRKRRARTWTSTVSSNLSNNRGVFFESGTFELNKQGWWKLIGNDLPKVMLDNRNKAIEEEKNQKEENKFDSNCKDLGLDQPNIKTDFPSFNFVTSSVDDSIIQTNINFPENFMTDSYENMQNENDDDDDDLSEDGIDIDVANLDSIENFLGDELPSKQEIGEFLLGGMESEDELSEIVQKYQIKMEDKYQSDVEENYQNEDFEYPPAEPSLFTQSLEKSKPWDECIESNIADVKPLMSIQEEEYYLDKIEKYKNLLNTAPIEVKQFYRKLVVRKQRRELGLPILNIDTLKKSNAILNNDCSRKYDGSQNSNIRLAGRCLESDAVYSSHTKRLLPHFIKRHNFTYSESPLWFRVLTDLLVKVNSKNTEVNCVPKSALIDYCYIKPQHLPAVNRLCTEFFWPVDVGDCLNYPDFTVVALYKKLVIGCAIMVPDAACNEAYIQFLVVRPEWQRAGIATSMLYHLYQTCMSNDITLHVSVSNPAANLYEKFGFKKEELVLDFYDKYLPPCSKDSRDAFFYRLAR